ncbi:hypothetical protein QFC20_000050 [Naganishia adeliensis]|uniref:Uncharacterized protein n=1 Tax=Naganishia adeliensis TaxID=92952 RepID=A0ACC2X1K4_9TREE|nr:hypothetical protein QFC20_000050 [Naganishia adeliensis]
MFKAKFTQPKTVELEQRRHEPERVHIDTAIAMDAKGSTSNPPAYESVSRGQASQVIIEDRDGKALGPVYDYFLIASSPVFADMLANAKERNVLSLPDSAIDPLSLVKIISGEAGAVHQFQSNSQASLNLYVLAKKYNIVGTHACWINDLLGKYVSDDPFECLAVACEYPTTDWWLVMTAIKGFGPFKRESFENPSSST